jgi:hypothetical protein
LFEGQEAAIGVKDQALVRVLPTLSADQRHITVQMDLDLKNLQTEPPLDEIKLAVTAKVPDQRTVAIVAGTRLADVRTETSSPLARVPYVNRLVRTVGYSREAVKVIVLLTPRIVREEESAEVRPLRGRIQAQDDGKFPLIVR